MAGQLGFFDVDERYAVLSAVGDPLARLAGIVDIEIFRAVLNAALARPDRSRGKRSSYDAVLMSASWRRQGPRDGMTFS
ncbi:hypothetical protein [Teichococcus vastitatis]|uniref:hypothetical protein n=1 Tax=Teichococcus vastitatis TaxID=2307076 RepID=UPI000E710178|nr:hypothetical protein [Pseudoroseomonas vastitatis]